MSDLTFYYNPRSRAAIVRWMLEEVGADYELRLVDLEGGENRRPEFLAVNPMGKLSTIVTAKGTVVTEAPAIIAWLADTYPEAGLAPAVTDEKRGTYYRWLFFGGSCFEPALSERMLRADAPPLTKSAVGWGDYDDVIDTIERAVAKTPYLLGDTFSGADLYIGAELNWARMFKAPRVGDSPAISDYVARVTDRDAYRRSLPG